MRNYASVTVLFMPYIFVTACDLYNPTNYPPWPDPAAVRAFDISPLRSNDAIRTSEALAFALGIAEVCGDVPDMRRSQSAEMDDRLPELGMASFAVLRAEVERLHPGDPENGTAADHLDALMMIRGMDGGRKAATARGCDAMRPAEADGFRAFWSWRPAEPPDPERR